MRSPDGAISASTRVHSPSKTGVNALHDALWRNPGDRSTAARGHGFSASLRRRWRASRKRYLYVLRLFFLCFIDCETIRSSRPPRGAFREGVREVGRDAVLAGGSRNLAPERPPEQRCWGEAPHRRAPRNAKADSYRRGAPRGADASSDRCVSISPEPTGQTRVTGAPSRRAIPLDWGTEKREETANARAQAKQQGPICFGCLTIEQENVARMERSAIRGGLVAR
jgi:hypothetical protein